MAERRSSDDPRTAGGDIAGPGGPYDEGAVIFDTRNAVLLDNTSVAKLDNPSDGRVILSLLMEGRVNRRADRTKVLYLLGPDGAAALITELVGLASRMGDDFAAEFMELVHERLAALPSPPAGQEGEGR